jgi:hypothetical protein
MDPVGGLAQPGGTDLAAAGEWISSLTTRRGVFLFVRGSAMDADWEESKWWRDNQNKITTMTAALLVNRSHLFPADGKTDISEQVKTLTETAAAIVMSIEDRGRES